MRLQMQRWRGDVVSISSFFSCLAEGGMARRPIPPHTHLQGPSKRYLDGPMCHSVGKVVGMSLRQALSMSGGWKAGESKGIERRGSEVRRSAPLGTNGTIVRSDRRWQEHPQIDAHLINHSGVGVTEKEPATKGGGVAAGHGIPRTGCGQGRNDGNRTGGVWGVVLRGWERKMRTEGGRGPCQ